MTRDQQKTLIRELSLCISEEIIKQIDDGKIPESWDGHELRALLAKRHNQFAEMTLLSNRRSRRFREFSNTVLVNNL